MATYPRLTTDTILSLKLIRQFLRDDPNYLEHAACSYDADTKDVLRAFGNGVAEVQIPEIDWSGDIETQITKVLNDMEAMGMSLGGLAPNEKLAFFKTKTSLMEKMISLQESALNIRQLNDFRTTVVELLEQICDKDQISEFMTALEGKLQK